MAPQFWRTFHLIFSIKLPPIEFSCLKLWLRESFRSRETQKVKGVKVTRKVKIVKRKFCNTHTFTIIAMNFAQEQLKIKVQLPHANKKPLARKRLFVHTSFSQSTLKLEQKISRRKTPRFLAPLAVSVWPKSLLQFDFKNYEKLWTDL